MLADDIIAAVGSKYSIADGISWLAGRLQHSQRFYLSPEVGRSAATVADLPLDQQLKALSLCKLPFPLCWYEWPGSVTSDVVRRFGMLIKTDDSLACGGITLVWQTASLNVSPWVLHFDWRPGAAPWRRDDIRAMSDAEFQAKVVGTDPKLAASSRAAITEDEERVSMKANPAMAALFDRMAANPEAGQKTLEIVANQWRGQAAVIRSAILLVNSKNLTGITPVTHSAKLQRARTRSGKAPLLDHSQINIKLSKALADQAGGAGDPHNPMRLHLVRGHFKIRATGLFWWAPHRRGSEGNVVIRQDRHVSRLVTASDQTQTHRSPQPAT